MTQSSYVKLDVPKSNPIFITSNDRSNLVKRQSRSMTVRFGWWSSIFTQPFTSVIVRFYRSRPSILDPDIEEIRVILIWLFVYSEIPGHYSYGIEPISIYTGFILYFHIQGDIHNSKKMNESYGWEHFSSKSYFIFSESTFIKNLIKMLFDKFCLHIVLVPKWTVKQNESERCSKSTHGQRVSWFESNQTVLSQTWGIFTKVGHSGRYFKAMWTVIIGCWVS